MSSILAYQWEVIKALCRFVLYRDEPGYSESGQIAEDREILIKAIEEV